MFMNNKQKQLADQEIELYKKEQKLKIDKSMIEYQDSILDEKRSFIKDVETLGINCAKDTKDFEHKFHSEMETLKIKIAKEEAKLEYLEKEVEVKTELANSDKIAYERIIKLKNDEIERLNTLFTKLIESSPQNIIQQKVK